MITSATAKGTRQYQEDSKIIAQFVNGTLLGVMDGHGGAAVSALLVALFPELLAEVCKTETEASQIFLKVFSRAHEVTKFYHEGSTASLVFIPKGETVAHIAVLGDSIVIAERKDGSLFVGPDHNARSNQEERSRAVARGGVFQGGYIWSGYGDNASGLQMTRALGDCALDQVLDRTPEVFTISLGNFLIVGSDGLIDPTHLQKNVLTSLVDEIANGRTAEELVQRAIDLPTNDNVTAVLWRR